MNVLGAVVWWTTTSFRSSQVTGFSAERFLFLCRYATGFPFVRPFSPADGSFPLQELSHDSGDGCPSPFHEDDRWKRRRGGGSHRPVHHSGLDRVRKEGVRPHDGARLLDQVARVKDLGLEPRPRGTGHGWCGSSSPRIRKGMGKTPSCPLPQCVVSYWREVRLPNGDDGKACDTSFLLSWVIVSKETIDAHGTEILFGNQ